MISMWEKRVCRCFPVSFHEGFMRAPPKQPPVDLVVCQELHLQIPSQELSTVIYEFCKDTILSMEGILWQDILCSPVICHNKLILLEQGTLLPSIRNSYTKICNVSLGCAVSNLYNHSPESILVYLCHHLGTFTYDKKNKCLKIHS
jgi:hypothetical protein